MGKGVSARVGSMNTSTLVVEGRTNTAAHGLGRQTFKQQSLTRPSSSKVEWSDPLVSTKVSDSTRDQTHQPDGGLP